MNKREGLPQRVLDTREWASNAGRRVLHKTRDIVDMARTFPDGGTILDFHRSYPDPESAEGGLARALGALPTERIEAAQRRLAQLYEKESKKG